MGLVGLVSTVGLAGHVGLVSFLGLDRYRKKEVKIRFHSSYHQMCKLVEFDHNAPHRH